MSSVVPLRSARNEASEWLARLNSEHATEEDRAQFAAWAAADPVHRRTFDEMRATWRRLEALGSFADLALPIDQAPRRPRRRWFAVAAGIGIVALAAGVLLWGSAGSFQTAIGEQRRVALPDASIAELNTDTRLDVKFGDSERLVRLRRGEARFKVAQQAGRPFIVRMDAYRVQAVGTEFTVRRKDSEIEVLVVEGAVKVNDTLVRAGQVLDTARPGAVVALSSGEIERRLAWHDGMVSFRGQTLREVLDELSRYNEARVEVADEAAAAIRISGYFRATDLSTFLTRLQENFPVLVSREARRTVIASRPPQPAR